MLSFWRKPSQVLAKEICSNFYDRSKCWKVWFDCTRIIYFCKLTFFDKNWFFANAQGFYFVCSRSNGIFTEIVICIGCCGIRKYYFLCNAKYFTIKVMMVTAILNWLLLVSIGCDECSSWIDLSITTNICSSTLGLVLKAIQSKSLPWSSILKKNWNLFSAFCFYCSFCFSIFMFISSK